MDIVSTTLRATVGALFVGHGTQKLLGWFGGPGLDATGDAFESMGLAPGRANAIAAGAAEAGGGLLLASGKATPLATATLSGTMITAIRHAHLKNGPWAQDGGFEFPLVLGLAVVAIAEERSDTWKALGALALGAAGSVAISELGKRAAAGEEPTPEEVREPRAAGAAAADATLADAELAAAPLAEPTDQLVAREEAAAAAEAGGVGGPTPPRSGSDPAMRAVEEAGGGEAEGFEMAQADLVANATHADGHGAPLLDRIDEEGDDAAADPVYGEADEARPPER